MMIRYALFALRWLARALAASSRRLHAPPEWVIFTLEGAYADYPHPGPLLLRLVRPPRPNLLDLADQLHAVAETPGVKGIVLQLRPLQLLPAQIDTLRGLIGELRESGKRVVVWSYGYSPTTYSIAANADEILLLPGGAIEPLGVLSPHVFLAEVLERAGVKAEVFRISPYKSAMDMLARTELSDEAREMARWLLDDRFEAMIEAVARGRGIDDEDARRRIDATPCMGEQARELGLVDGILTQEELPVWLGTPGRPAEIREYEGARRRLRLRAPRRPGRYVALIPIEGLIADGHSSRPRVPPPARLPIVGEGRTGDLTVAQITRRLLFDRRVGAVVVYVNSGGGSATASEAMRSALQRLGERKPVVVAMGGIAASGGYYVALPGREIFAQPGTVTGSIGVVMAKGLISGLLDRIGVHREILFRGRNALFWSSDRPLGDEDRARIQEWVQDVYELFVDRVAAGRRMDRGEVDAIGGGRVWTGRQALEHGLIDRAGSLHDAIRRARELGRLHDRAPVRVATPGRRPLGPPRPADATAGLLAGLSRLEGRPLLLSAAWPAESFPWPLGRDA